eukprot:526668-Amphidinium_carterae.1
MRISRCFVVLIVVHLLRMVQSVSAAAAAQPKVNFAGIRDVVESGHAEKTHEVSHAKTHIPSHRF